MPAMLEFLWLDPKSPPRLRRKVAWQELLKDHENSESSTDDPPLLAHPDLAPPGGADAFLIMARTAPVDAEGIRAAVTAATRADGKYVPPLLAITGDLRFPHDELSALKGTMANAIPFMAGDEPLKAAVAAAGEFLKMPDLMTTPAAIDAFTLRLREAFARVKRAVPATYLEAQTDRALRETRCYQRRPFQGTPCVRALLTVPPDRTPMLAYLPESASSALPLFPSVAVRILAEVQLLADPSEAHPFGLRILALARQIPEAPAATDRS